MGKQRLASASLALMSLAWGCLLAGCDYAAQAGPKTVDAAPMASSPSPSTSPPATIAPALTFVGQKELDDIPTLFDPQSRLVAVRKVEMQGPEGCDIWDLATGLYRGQISEKECQRLPFRGRRCLMLPDETRRIETTTSQLATCYAHPEENGVLRSPDEKLVARWSGATLAVTGRERDVSVNVGCTSAPCPEVVAVAWSPDGTRLALGRSRARQLHIVNSATGQLEQTLRLGPGEVVLPEMLRWAEHGLVALIGELTATASRPDRNGEGGDRYATVASCNRAHLLLWRSLTAAPQRLAYRSIEFSQKDREDTSLLFDPQGRYLFENSNVLDEFTIQQVFDVVANRVVLRYPEGGYENKACSWSSVGEGQWIPGPWPVFETIASRNHAHCSPPYKAFRIYTAPHLRRLEIIPLKEDPQDAYDVQRQVQADGKTLVSVRSKLSRSARAVVHEDIDPSRRWQGTGERSLRRLPDNAELTFDAAGAHTDSGVFDGSVAPMSKQTFLLAPDPLKAQAVRGIQVAHLFHHPRLVEDFFEGKPVAPLPAARGAIGRPPRLDQLGVSHHAGQSPNLVVKVLAHDGGDGVSQVRVWADNALLTLPTPLTLIAEQPTSLPLTLAEKFCGHVLLLACNAQGLACSPPVDVPFCPYPPQRPR